MAKLEVRYVVLGRALGCGCSASLWCGIFVALFEEVMNISYLLKDFSCR